MNQLAMRIMVATIVGAFASEARAHSPAPLAAAMHIAYAARDAAPRPWTHPVAGIERPLPDTDGGHFGAHRPARKNPECGRGHCGVDLYGDPGAPVLAIQPGKVLKVVRGSAGRSGRYVALEHAGGLRSYYMHLAAVRDDLEPGTLVRAGEHLGTLGASGVRRSSPHLHFAVSRRRGKGERYENPERRLAGAEVVHAFERIGLPE